MRTGHSLTVMHAGIHTPPGDLLQGMLGYLLQCMLGYTPPSGDLLQGMLGYTHPLETCCKECWDTSCNACWDTHPLETCCKACWDTSCNACWDTHSPCEQNDKQVQKYYLGHNFIAAGNKHLICWFHVIITAHNVVAAR